MAISLTPEKPKKMAKKKPIVITIKETRHKRQPWTYTIDKPGTDGDEAGAYSRIWTAKRGALRQLGDTYPEITSIDVFCPDDLNKKVVPLEWRIERLKTKSKK